MDDLIKYGSILLIILVVVALFFVYPNKHLSVSTKNKPIGSAEFSKAYYSFVAYASKTLNTSADNLAIVPFEEVLANKDEHRVGSLWSFSATAISDPPTTINGWANPEGIVVTSKQNIGLMLDQADVWTKNPKLNAKELAEELVWSMGGSYSGYNVVYSYDSVGSGRRLYPPEIKVNEDSTGALKFFIKYRVPGSDGAGGGPYYFFECIVNLSSDHKADLEISENLNS